ncbi:CoA ester lyase [Bosea sp. RAF48]|uniref:HpcH/HpaI aldolase/citrate lyase family protein n=1 Tax=Bosea sp. RAF48 TaxID=3237480 RepID=UPI003F8FDBB8
MAPVSPAWRSLLYVPVTSQRFVAGAGGRGADAVILDLEDSIPLGEKAAARSALAGAIAAVAAQGGPDILVRVNRNWRLLVRDLEAAIMAGVKAIVLPKVTCAVDIVVVAEIIAELEAERGLAAGAIGIVALIEDPGALFRAAEIAGAHPRVVALSLGDEDFANAAGIEPTAETLLHPKQLIVFAAKAAGIAPLGFIGTLADYRDLDALRLTLERSRRFGYQGAPCIHPSQVPLLNAAFSPTEQETERAKRVVAAFDAQTALGGGAAALDGTMIDRPVVERARRLIDRAAALSRPASSTSGDRA